jgi:hypothetical protein
MSTATLNIQSTESTKDEAAVLAVIGTLRQANLGCQHAAGLRSGALEHFRRSCIADVGPCAIPP